MDYLSRLRDFRLIARPLIDAYESCSLTDPTDDFYLDRDLSEDHASETLEVVTVALCKAIEVQFPELSTFQVDTLMETWAESSCVDWRSMRILIQEKLEASKCSVSAF